MKRAMLYFSILLLCISVVFVSGSWLPRERSEFPPFASKYDSYNLSVSLEEHDNIELHIYPGAEWKKFLEPAPDDVHAPFVKSAFVNITDPEANYTFVQFRFVAERVGETLYVYDIKVIPEQSRDGIIAAEEQDTPFKGTVKHSGNYTVEVLGYMPGGGGPPYYISVCREEVRTDYPYSSLLPAGAATGILGLVMLAWSAKSAKPQRVRKKLQVDNHKTKPGFAT